MSDRKDTGTEDVTAANETISRGERDGASQPPREPEDVRPGTGIAGVGAMMGGDQGSETAENLDRSLAVQGQRDDEGTSGYDEEE